MRLRAAQPSDAAALAALNDELGYPTTAVVLQERLQRLLGSARDLVLVAEALTSAKESLLGWLHVTRSISLESGERAEIVGLVVSNVARRNGVGRALVAAAQQWATQQGVLHLIVRSNVQRDVAHCFYPALGFEHSKTQHVYRMRLV